MFFLAGFFVPNFSCRSASVFDVGAESFLPLRDFNFLKCRFRPTKGGRDKRRFGFGFFMPISRAFDVGAENFLPLRDFDPS